MEAVQFRIARPTNRLSEIVEFYTKGLGMEIIGSFSGHAGYDGVMLGMPDSKYHLEFTCHIDQPLLNEPSKENLLVFYYDDPDKYFAANNRLQAMNCLPVKPENPYWEDKSKTYEDPDKWRIILFNGLFTAEEK